MFIYFMVFLTIMLNILVTVHVVRDNRRYGYEKIAESGLIWILPAFGALISLCITVQGPSQIRAYEDIHQFFK